MPPCPSFLTMRKSPSVVPTRSDDPAGAAGVLPGDPDLRGMSVPPKLFAFLKYQPHRTGEVLPWPAGRGAAGGWIAGRRCDKVEATIRMRRAWAGRRGEMNSEAEWKKALKASPEDKTLLLAYGDWLEER